MKMNIPKELRYSKNHEWVRVEGEKVIVGIDDYAQSQLGDVVFVELPEIGSIVTCGDSFSVVESVKAVSDIYAPVSGEIIEVNEVLGDTPECINEDPYGQGWIVVIQLKDASEVNNLMDSAAYQTMLEEGENS
ncbi:MAG: Glycine cleavage system protein [Pelosinus sp.]|jgi:glycine cleavage system H protein|nr:Glycine cleavage system protein [Pelosinus sp.]